MQDFDVRIDYYPTHEHEGIKYRRGHVLPFGATMVPNGVNFQCIQAQQLPVRWCCSRKVQRRHMLKFLFLKS